ncbi:dihydrolipoamide acetyltransferase family protein [Bacteroidota bacterium]
MNQFEIIMPKMGESIQEATITKWFVSVGDKVEEDDVLVEIATDKVDSEIPSPVDGVINKLLFNEGDVVAVGEIIALVSLDGEIDTSTEEVKPDKESESETVEMIADQEKTPSQPIKEQKEVRDVGYINKLSGKFYSPLVKSIAKQENITIEELESIIGSGKDGRIRKDDILNYIDQRSKGESAKPEPKVTADHSAEQKTAKASPSLNASDEIIEMDRMRRLIADHMVMSKRTSPHVTSVVEADVTNIVKWREGIKDDFLKKQGQKITYMPIIIEAVAKAIRDFPGVNVSVDGYNIIQKKNINIGIAVALPTGNLIVPVIKNADQKNLIGLASDLNGYASAARENNLNPDDIQGGTFTITNFGSFKNIIGTPIINQPQVAILATGSIEKKPAVIETPQGDTIGIRHKMFLSLSYDHRVVDGALGGAFLRRIADYLEDFDTNRTA